jgi:hypothetical protein
VTEPIKPDYYAETKAMLQRHQDALPADIDPEARMLYTHPAVIEHVAAMKEFPEAFNGMPPTSFRMIVKSYEENQQRERERPRLQTQNPPQAVIERGLFYSVNGYMAAIFCFLSCLASVVVGIINPVWNGIPLILIPLICVVLTFSWSYNSFVKARNSKLPWDTSYHTITYNPALKSGKSAVVEIQLELPVGWSNPETLSRLENCAKSSLYELFANSDTVPLRSKVFDCIEQKLAMKQRELNLGLCRMQLLRNVDPSMPAFGSRHVFSSNGIIVTYDIADLWRTDAVNAKLAEMLLANPATDLTRHANALNIRFIDIEKQPPKTPPQKGFAFNG